MVPSIPSPKSQAIDKRFFEDFSLKFHLHPLVRIHENFVDLLLAHFDGQAYGGVDFVLF